MGSFTSDRRNARRSAHCVVSDFCITDARVGVANIPAAHEQVEVELNAADRMIDTVKEGCDPAIRITDDPAATTAERICLLIADTLRKCKKYATFARGNGAFKLIYSKTGVDQ